MTYLRYIESSFSTDMRSAFSGVVKKRNSLISVRKNTNREQTLQLRLIHGRPDGPDPRKLSYVDFSMCC